MGSYETQNPILPKKGMKKEKTGGIDQTHYKDKD
jgi:hypothetical protein